MSSSESSFRPTHLQDAPLTEREIDQVTRLLGDPFAWPPEFMAAIKVRLENDPPVLLWDSILGFNDAALNAAVAGGAGANWVTGDYKTSAQAATHVAADGGTWYLCDGTALPAGETALIALVGANAPDSRGRIPVMKGTHVDVDAIGDNDGAAVGDRRPSHKHTVVQPAISAPAITVTDPGHDHDANVGDSGSASQTFQRSGENGQGVYATTIQPATTGITAGLASNPVATGGTVGPQVNTPTDQPAFIVVGSLFIHS